MRFVSLPWMRVKVDANNSSKQFSSLPADSVIIAWYLALESGNLWFPAQVYNRENGHVEFMLSCYDAELSYDPHTDTFQARYPPHGRSAVSIEHAIPWERLRAPLVDTPPHRDSVEEKQRISLWFVFYSTQSSTFANYFGQ
ncbi:hypothetical protein Lal_00048837 [Lupinus albus]|uniref:Uncharacterized protein n=1 Tax=Lupinus albus TaxID=3870 RepID=A0A6A4PB59_LUPAL|nr:hypothetical protein Lalb_Chr17g0347811 [Lupinus albus]KAF1864272.1 hypothetical protein Lal_00048837 [Lupinus albus]